MKLYAAALALSAAALLVDDTAAYYASSSAGSCLETVVANVEDGTFDNGNYDGVQWTADAGFYANRNGDGNYNYYANNGEADEADAEQQDAEQQDQQDQQADGYAYNNNNAYQAAQWAENSIGYQLQSLAEYLNIKDDNEDNNEDQDANGEEGEDANEANDYVAFKNLSKNSKREVVYVVESKKPILVERMPYM